MRRVIDRRAADIHGDARGAFALGHDLFSMGLRVVETKRTGHALYPRNLARRTPWGLRGCISRSEEHTSALQSLMRISYAVICLQKKTTQYLTHNNIQFRTNSLILTQSTPT